MVKVILVIILVSGLLITGCAGKSNQVARVGMPAPNFQLKNLDGQSVSLSDLQGKPVLINFWASWCQPCVLEMPLLQEIYDDWSSEDLVLVTINVGESSSKVEKFIQGLGLSLPVLLDIKAEVAQQYGIRFFPTTLFIDKNGIIKDRKLGMLTSKSEIESILKKIVP